MARAIKGDYIGFTFDGVHSSELGLIRVSNGSRYETDLLPPLQDKKAQVVGRDGEVYFGSQYGTRPIKVPIAFDNLTEEGFNKLKRLLANKTPRYLWFDETPYKQWLVKSANVQNLKWICFDESRNGKEYRIYKGEGTLEFNCFSPYAESRALTFDDEVSDVIVWEYVDGRRKQLVMTATSIINDPNNIDDDTKIKKTLRDYYNFEEWYKSSRLKDGDNFSIGENKVTEQKVYNAGDIPADIQLTFYNAPTSDLKVSLYSKDNVELKSITLKPFSFLKIDDVEDVGFILDSKIKMIKGFDEYGDLTGHNYNKNRKSGDFFKIPTMENSDDYFIIKTSPSTEFKASYKHHYI